MKKNAASLGVKHGWYPRTRTTGDSPGTQALVSGFPELVIEGKAVTCSSPTASSCFPDRSDMRARHPRTAMGVTKDRRTLILAVVDGRSTSSIGMYGTELAALMKELGAYVAFNLDGGGSSQMWTSSGGTINRPSDGTARAVANHLGALAKGSGAKTNCFTAGGCYPATVPGAESSRFKDMPTRTSGYADSVLIDKRGWIAPVAPAPTASTARAAGSSGATWWPRSARARSWSARTRS